MKNKKKKGFTLIELLAIIVILAIIAVITVPIILNVIDNSKVGAIKDSAYGYKDAVSKYYVTKLYEDQNFKLDGTYTVTDGKMTGTGMDNVEIPVTGNLPTSGSLVYKNNVLESGYLIFENYRVEIENGEITDISKDDILDNSNDGTGNNTGSSVLTDDTSIEFVNSDGFEAVNVTVSITPVPAEADDLTYSYYYRLSGSEDYIFAYSGPESSYRYDVDLYKTYDFKVVVSDGVNSKEATILNTFYCFVAGTKVYTDTGYRNIEDIKVGDMVYALDLETGDHVLKRVERTIVSNANELYHLTIEGEVVSATPRHQFYVVDKGWVRAYDIKVGDQLVTKDGIKLISEIDFESLEQSIIVYNLVIESLHNYLVTEYSILVHNGSPM